MFRTVVLQANSERDRDEWLKVLSNIVKDDSKAKLINYMSSASSTGPQTLPSQKDIIASVQSIRFDLPETPKKTTMSELKRKEKTSAYYETFDVRYLGLMNVIKADKGNEYIHETIRQIMAERAKRNLFKMYKLKLIITDEYIYLVSDESHPDETTITTGTGEASATDQPILCEFRLADIAFWCVHKENDRLFGFIIKEKEQRKQNSIKFYCYSFECDINTQQICDSITQSTQIAFKMLLEQNKIDNLKQRTSEKQLLLDNINRLPDKPKQTVDDDVLIDKDDDDDDDELIDVGNDEKFSVDKSSSSISASNNTNASNILSTINSPNPNFFILDKEDLDDFQIDDSNQQTTTNEKEASRTTDATAQSSLKRVESDA